MFEGGWVSGVSRSIRSCRLLVIGSLSDSTRVPPPPQESPEDLGNDFIYSFVFLRVYYLIRCVHSSVWALKKRKWKISVVCKCCLWFRVVHGLQFDSNALRFSSGLCRDPAEDLKPSRFSLIGTVWLCTGLLRTTDVNDMPAGGTVWSLCVKALTVRSLFNSRLPRNPLAPPPFTEESGLGRGVWVRVRFSSPALLLWNCLVPLNY